MNRLSSIWRRRDYASRLVALPSMILLVARCYGQSLAPVTNPPAFPVPSANTVAKPAALIATGHALFRMNCAHCHAADATGDEGPDLHGLVKSDAKLAALIKNGVKGEMPRFGSKFTKADVQALTAFLDSMK